MTADTFSQDKKKHRKTGLQSPDLLVRHPVSSVIIILLGSLIFGILAYFVMQNGSLVKWDLDIVNRMYASALSSPAWIKNVMLAGYYIGQQGYIATGVILGLYFLIRRFWKEFFMVIVLYAGQGVLFLSLTSFVARPRPVFSENIGSVIPYPSFPSGHMISSVIMFGLLAYFIVPRISSQAGKAAAILLAVLLVLYIGYSRFFMGAHYITDIIAGAALGVAWVTLTILSIEMINRKAVKKNEQEK